MVSENALPKVSSPVSLVSYASENCTRSFLNSARTMGITLDRIGDEQWIEAAGPRSRTIVLIGSSPILNDNFIDHLARSAGPRLLVIASEPDAADVAECVRIASTTFHDFLVLPCSGFELIRRVSLLFPRSSNDDQLEDPVLSEQFLNLGLIGRSSEFLRAMDDLVQFARSEAPVLIQGETGTGKELAARAIHQFSSRAHRPFVSINCGAIPDNLIENELFGHERGAFTDAKEAQVGLVAQADEGTLFLDEVDTLSPVAQVALLRFLESHEYRRLGGKCIKHSNARVVAASNADLAKLADSGDFRRDLLFRLDVCSVSLPPLRERLCDIELLATHFLKRYAEKYKCPEKTIHPGTMEWLLTFPWRGNIRELDNFIHRQFLLCKSTQIFVPEPVPGQPAYSSSPASGVPWRRMSYKAAKAGAMDAFERSYLTWLMAETGGNLSRAARKTSLQRSSLRRLLQKHQIDKGDWKSA